MDDPVQIARGIADDDGVVTLRVFVGEAVRDPGEVLIQAFEFENCKVSQLVVEVYE